MCVPEHTLCVPEFSSVGLPTPVARKKLILTLTLTCQACMHACPRTSTLRGLRLACLLLEEAFIARLGSLLAPEAQALALRHKAVLVWVPNTAYHDHSA